MTVHPIVLTICDGFGLRTEKKGNAIDRAKTPNLDRLMASWPHTEIAASGEAVGLPAGQQGNSEVGHLTIGAGRVIYQPLTRIGRAISDGSFFTNEVLMRAVETAKHRHVKLHCIGLLSPGGVHSHMDHALALAQLAKTHGFEDIVFDCFLDGRDTPPSSAIESLELFIDKLREIGVGRVSSVGGRFFAMDRDRRWGRVEQAYNVLVGKDGAVVEDPLEYIRDCYDSDKTDEFIPPVAVAGPSGLREPITDGDVIIFFNFRPDRMRELVTAFHAEHFASFVRGAPPANLLMVCFAEYDHTMHLPVAFPVVNIQNTLTEVVSAQGWSQFHIAETEKYAHVTYFFNGGREEPFDLEERELIPSPKVRTYDTFPEMSAYPITNAVVERIHQARDAFIVINFANADMVGHTGDMKATIRAIQSIDICLGRVADATLAVGGVFVLTADHGNAEEMIDIATGEPKTSHTTNPVPFLVCGEAVRDLTIAPGGGLCNVAPTLVQLMGLPHVSDMATPLIQAGAAVVPPLTAQ